LKKTVSNPALYPITETSSKPKGRNLPLKPRLYFGKYCA
jgi:hypothetical protein